MVAVWGVAGIMHADDAPAHWFRMMKGLALFGYFTSEIGATQGLLRAAHLKYHLATLQALQPEQVQRYAELRGYTNAAPNTSTNTGSQHQHRH